MGFYSMINNTPEIAKDKIVELRSICKAASDEWNEIIQNQEAAYSGKEQKEITESKVLEGLDGHVVDFLCTVVDVDEHGLVLNEYYDKWGETDKIAEFLLPYVDPDIVDTLSFTGEDGLTWKYIYMNGKIYGDRDFVNDKETAKELMRTLHYPEHLLNYIDVVEAFQKGIAWVLSLP